MHITDKGKKILKIGTITAGSIIGLIAIIIICIAIILTPAHLTKMVNKYSNEYLNAEVKIESASLNLFKFFPHASIELHNGIIVSKVFNKEHNSNSDPIPASADTLLKFNSFSIAVNLPQLIFGKINIRKIALSNPYIYAYIAENGEANWEIYKSSNTTTSPDNNNLSVKIRQIDITESGKIIYNSRPDSIRAAINLNTLKFRGKLSLNVDETRIKRAYIKDFSIGFEKLWRIKSDSLQRMGFRFTINSLNIKSPAKGKFLIDAITHTDFKLNNLMIAKNFPLSIDGNIAVDSLKKGKFNVDNLKIDVGEIPIVFNGSLLLTKEGISTDFLCGKTDNFQISKLIALIPEQIYPDIHNIETDAKLIFDIDMNGMYNFTTKSIPSFTAQLQIPPSSIKLKNSNLKIKNIATNALASYNASHPDSCLFALKQLIIDGDGLQFNGNGEIKDFFNDPDIHLNLKLRASLDTLRKFLPKETDIMAKGSLSGKLNINSRLSNLNLYNLGNALVEGNVNSKFLDIDVPSKNICCMLMKTNIRLGTQLNPLRNKIKNAPNVLFLDVLCDSADIHVGKNMALAGRHLKMSGKNSSTVLKGEKEKVYPFGGEFKGGMFEYEGEDSIGLKLNNTLNRFSIMPEKDNHSIPIIRISSNSKKIAFNDKENKFSFTEPDIKLTAVIDNREEKRRQARREKRLDSLQQIYPAIQRDSLGAYSRRIDAENGIVRERRGGTRIKDEFSNEDVNLRVSRNLSSLIRSLNINTTIKASHGEVITPYFPLVNTLDNINMSFTTDVISMNETIFRLGSSIFRATGKISGLKDALLGRDAVNIALNINADTLNVNELVTAGAKGSEYSSKSISANNATTITATSTMSTDTLGLIVIPGNINAEIKLDTKYGLYSNLVLNRVTGELIARDRCLQINNLKAITSAGEMDLTAFYSTKNKKNLSTGFDVEMKKIDVKKLIDIIPSIDTLLPMLRSFEGIITSQMAATANIDDKMNIILPSLKGVARIKGQNMVLLDGETFSEISKKLRFKNRRKNNVDSIAVELLVKDNKIDVFPFIMEMDRYRTAISGTQNLDMSFNYHISVLKSPLPIRLGITIFGNTDKYHFRIGKAKYKNTNLPVFSQLIDDARLNLRTNIINIFHKGVNAALNEGRLSTNKIDKFIQKNPEMENSAMEELSSQESSFVKRMEDTTSTVKPVSNTNIKPVKATSSSKKNL